LTAGFENSLHSGLQFLGITKAGEEKETFSAFLLAIQESYLRSGNLAHLGTVDGLLARALELTLCLTSGLAVQT
jgi:hypothetical protein